MRVWHESDDFKISQVKETREILIDVSAKIVRRCFDFSLEFIKSKHDKSIKSHGSDFQRPWWELIYNTTEGKIAEVASIALLNFAHSLETKTECDLVNSKFKFDDEIKSGKHNLDANDIVGATKRVDVKATKRFAKWLTVNEYKELDGLDMQSEIYILMKVDLMQCVGSSRNGVINAKSWERFDGAITCSFCGWAFVDDFFYGADTREHPYFEFLAGESLINADEAHKIKLELDNGMPYESYLANYVKNSNWRLQNSMKVSLYSKKQYGLPVNSLNKKIGDLYRNLI